MPISFELNGKAATVDVEGNTPLLWVLRDTLNMTGTKYGCGIAACGACTVLVNGEAARSCVYPVSGLAGAKVTTIEGLSSNHSHPLQQAWIAEQVPQCGYCQSGQIMAAAAFLAKNSHPTPEQVDAAMSDNICRCGTAQRIRKAVLRASQGTGVRSQGSAASSAESHVAGGAQ
jgi:aerobic-type carbon monoxide dehydrogenase small subunit (CoxS/CutS family)